MTGLKKALRSRRGFTLVELIVVLVIMGVLGTVTVPALTGYIDSSKEKQAVSETQACVETVTRIAAQKYAQWQQATISGTSTDVKPLMDWAGTTADKAPDVSGGDVALTEGTGRYLLHVTNSPSGGIMTQDVAKDAGVSGHVNSFTCNNNGQLLYLVYTSADGIKVVYTNVGTSSSVSNGDIEKVDVPKPEESNPKPDPEPNPEPGVKKLSVTFYKCDKDTKDNISNAEMKVISGTTFTESWTTDGSAHTVQLPAGDYIYQEFTAPDGYQKAADIHFSVVESNGTLYLSGDKNYVEATSNTVTMYDEKSTTGGSTSSKDLTFRVQDPDTKAYIANVSFNLTLPDGTFVASATTNSEGIISFKVNLGSNHGESHPHTYHEYTLTPTSWPVGRQQVFPISFSLFPCKNDGTADTSDYPEDFRLSIWNDQNYRSGGYPIGTVSDDAHTYTMYNPAVKYGYITEVEANNHEKVVRDAVLTVSQGTHSFSINTNDCPKMVALKLHEGDNLPDGVDFLVNNTSITIEEKITPTGYSKPYTRTIGFDGIFKKYGENSSFYISNDGLTIYLLAEEKNTCTTVFRKIDDRGHLISEPTLKLTSVKSDSIVHSQYWSSNSADILNSPSVSFELKPDTYTVQSNYTPDNYTKPSTITFTVNKGEYNKTITIVYHNVTDGSSDVTLDTITFKEAQNWAHKLTTDPTLKFKHEILYWKGDYYYSYNDSSSMPNKYKQLWSNDPTKNKLDLDADKDHDGYTMAPDPVTFYEKNKNRTDPNGIVLKLGNLWNETTIRDVSSDNTIKRGDLYLYQSKLYVYVGDTELSSAPPAQPDESKNSKPYAYAEYWHKIDQKKYTIDQNQ